MRINALALVIISDIFSILIVLITSSVVTYSCSSSWHFFFDTHFFSIQHIFEIFLPTCNDGFSVSIWPWYYISWCIFVLLCEGFQNLIEQFWLYTLSSSTLFQNSSQDSFLLVLRFFSILYLFLCISRFCFLNIDVVSVPFLFLSSTPCPTKNNKEWWLSVLGGRQKNKIYLWGFQNINMSWTVD